MERILNNKIMFIEGGCYESLSKQCSNFDYIVDDWIHDFYNGTRQIYDLSFDIKDAIQDTIRKHIKDDSYWNTKYNYKGESK